MEYSISVVIPLYNKAAYIQRAINSIVKQTVLPSEIIVVDDGSTDGGGEIVKNIAHPAIKLIQQKNAGVSMARNRGIEEAKSDLVAFLDADDEWCPGFLEKILEMVDKFPGCAGYATAYGLIDRDRLHKPLSILASDDFVLNPIEFFKYSGKWPLLSSSSIVIWKEVFNQVGNFVTGIKMGEDLEMWGRIAARYSFAYSPKIFALYYQDISNRACKTLRYSDHFPFKHYLNIIRQDKQISDEIIPYWVRYWEKNQIKLIKGSLRLGNFADARSYCQDLETESMNSFIWKRIAYLPEHILIMFHSIYSVYLNKKFTSTIGN